MTNRTYKTFSAKQKNLQKDEKIKSLFDKIEGLDYVIEKSVNFIIQDVKKFKKNENKGIV